MLGICMLGSFRFVKVERMHEVPWEGQDSHCLDVELTLTSSFHISLLHPAVVLLSDGLEEADPWQL